MRLPSASSPFLPDTIVSEFKSTAKNKQSSGRLFGQPLSGSLSLHYLFRKGLYYSEFYYLAVMVRYIVIVAIILAHVPDLRAQYDSIYEQFNKFEKFYASGDMIRAEACMQIVLNSKDSCPEEFMVAAYNNLGVINNLFGNYKESLEYYDQAEALISEKEIHSQYLGDIYLNKARIFNIQNLYSLATTYLEKGIRIYTNIIKPDENVLTNISSTYLNLGISYIGLKDYKKAYIFLEKSIELKIKYRLANKALPYLSMANLYAETKEWDKVEMYYLKSIDEFIKEYDENYYRLADVYIHYGLFLRSMGKVDKAYEYHLKTLDLCLKNYDNKHPEVSRAYKQIGEHYFNQSDYSSALKFYQKAIIALVNDFNDEDIFANPELSSTLLDIELLKILQRKSEAFELYAEQQEDEKAGRLSMEKSLETIELAVLLIDKIRSEYLSEESRIFLMENEKETYFSATHIAHNLYNLTGDKTYLNKMYAIARQAKSSILRNAIKDSELFYSIGIPDSLGKMYRDNLSNLEAYNHLIHEEIKKTNPDTVKADFWKDAVFDMNREKERLEEKIHTLFPQYRALLKKTEPISLEEIQENLKNGETLIEYFLSNQYNGNGRTLYVYTLTRERLLFHKTYLDSLFTQNLEIIKQRTIPFSHTEDPLISYKNYTGALYHMYEQLIQAVEKNFASGKLIIIPDEEIAYLPFDAFITNMPSADQSNYEGLDYLLRRYSISYGYTSSLIFNKEKTSFVQNKVYSFSPVYNDIGADNDSGNEFLRGTANEIRAIYKWFRGKEYSGGQATEYNYKSATGNKGIFHLAMHSSVDTVNSKYSYLLFDTKNDTLEDGKLFHYEISLSRIRSPMVVLSACNTGSGNLYHGEGIMSLSRAFILAGASSVIKTFWDINDEVSSKIIIEYYNYLSKGKEKDEAMRLAKLKYLNSSHPAFTNPYYWAAYQVIGNKEAIKENNLRLLIKILIILLAGGGLLSLYFKRRRILTALSR